MKIEYYSFNRYLHKFNIINDLNYEYKEKYEIMEYYLFKYLLYKKKKERIRKKMKIEEIKINKESN